MAQSSGFDRTKKIVIGIVDVIIYHFAILLSFLLRYNWELPERNYQAFKEADIFIYIGFILLNILFGIYVLYNKQKTDFLYLTIIIQLLMSVFIMAMTFVGRWFAFPRTIILISFVVSTVLLFTWRMLIFKLYERIDGTKKVMVVGSEKNCKKAIHNFESSKNKRHVITKAVVDNFYENIKKNMDSVDIVYLAGHIKDDEKTKIYDMLIRNKTKLFLNTSFENMILVNPNMMSIEDESVIEVSNFQIPPEDDLIKRMVDIAVSLVLTIIASPIMLITGFLIKATSKGPVFYKQIRITKDQREFNILKFRTMSATAEKDSGPVLATANDARVTTIGKYLRSLRIDELPQLINVLKGDMSLVGPRPERPFFVDQFNKENPYYYLRHNVRAGITGYAQVYGKYATDFNSKLNFDLVYIKKYTFILDIKILLQTIKILFDKVSSKGLEEENIIGRIPDTVEIFK
ncbi:UDP-phosphate galactose phosphotransferase [Marinilactibacillus psychrotolerans]|uniref:Bacterial sugar transferase n=1 Tax=Marinilactibacillus psychrotolerans TaxID=191770 RepID=A0AAV3X028_9LACT|nr:sugar transferase [Marinilactibacillus psychrotolerans]GEL68111.1 UDP-phosphate galactose phosphotransferase [Marinilactibacillus psychrotolerans]GEQ36554.1 bacterial sugar transferase [Marinilactibacillus psychrotolerans]SDD40316.1 exopolysaccharide biosynthesis polyprenyl glycosylphosphotransferase [Marinilactibacillus psychrotolerans]